MRKFILFLLLLCLHYSARGQTQYAYRYWFDGDIATSREGIATTDAWHMDVDLSQLREGFHTIHLQVTDGKGVSSIPLTRNFFLSREGGDLRKGFYWFDDEETARPVNGNVQGVLTIDVTDLPEGFHTLHYQVLRADGLYSQIETRSFYKLQGNQAVGHLTFMCYIDGVPYLQERVSAEDGKATWLLDVSALPIGFHKLQVRAIMDNGASTTNREAFFLRATMPSELDAMTCICAVDGKVFKQEKMQATHGTALWQMDVSELPIGFHRLQLRAVSGNGVSTPIREAFFLRNAMESELNALSCIFSIDGKEYKTVDSGMRDGVFHCDLDVASLSDGLHKVSYILTNGQGAQTTVKSQYFIKQPVGGNSIKKYQYWLNDKDDKAQLIVQDKVTDPLKLITLLPIEPQPLRSSLFHFELKDGKPMMYAKNEIHLRFFDAAGRFTDASDQFVDYQVGQKVVPVDELYNTQTFPKVAENDIRWYTMQSAPGDTAAFRLSQAATMQVFAPSGKEVFNTSGSSSVQWSGIHTWENGTYYLAVHDVTGSKENMTLDYMHLDKYDVVDWNVHTVGNGGCSTITFKGNGFRDLYAVDLLIAKGDTIHSIDISHDSDAETAVTFDFSGAELGAYNAVFHFTEGDKRMANVVTVEEAVDIELATNVSFPSIFSRSATYTVKITNKGNMTAYAVPIYTWIKSLTKDGIYRITYDGLELSPLFDVAAFDSLSADDLADLKQLNEQYSDDHYFHKLWADDEDHPGDSIYVRSNYFFTNIAPNETKTLRLTIYTSEVDTYAYFTVPEDWPSYCFIQEGGIKYAKVRFRAPKQQNQYCCISDKIDCVLSTAAFWLDMGSAVSFVFGPEVAGIINAADCSVSVAAAVNKTSKIIACGDEGFEDDMRSMVGNAAKSAISAAISCVAAKFSKLGNLKFLKEHSNYSNLGNGLSALVAYVDKAHPSDGDFSCFKEWSKPKPGCPPPPPGGGGSNGGKSHDPNDIYGYLSEAGSKFMTDSIERVNYTIEFENDTTFATLAAHTIVIRDTLDSRNFDLKAFVPTGVKLGGREVFLDEADVVTKSGVTNFVKTIDVRPEINAIAQVEGTYSQQTGIAEWRFTSLDPMTMEPTDDIMQGILPVNYDGTSGIGEVMFEIGVKANKGDGAQIANRAGIVFDYEEAILTPTWVNTVDAVAPVSTIRGGIQTNDSTLTLRLAGEDVRSGVWKYNVYAQFGAGTSWELVAENVTDTLCDVRIYEGIDYSFCVLATDSAGNVEKKVFSPEFSLSSDLLGDANGDGNIDLTDAVMITYHSLGTAQPNLNLNAADVNRDGVVDLTDAIIVVYRSLGIKVDELTIEPD